MKVTDISLETGKSVVVILGFDKVPVGARGIIEGLVRGETGWRIVLSLRYAVVPYGQSDHRHSVSPQRFNASICVAAAGNHAK